MMQEPTGITAHSFLTLPPLGTTILEPHLGNTRGRSGVLKRVHPCAELFICRAISVRVDQWKSSVVTNIIRIEFANNELIGSE